MLRSAESTTLHTSGTTRYALRSGGAVGCSDENPPSVEQVARVVAASPTIGAACDALRRAGWRATIAANRITVQDSVFAQFVGMAGDVHARWIVHGIAGTTAAGSLVSCASNTYRDGGRTPLC